MPLLVPLLLREELVVPPHIPAANPTAICCCGAQAVCARVWCVSVCVCVCVVVGGLYLLLHLQLH